MSTPLVLVTNDDGINAPGLAALAEALAPLGDVYVVAPEREQSTVGHALTLHCPLRVDRLAERRVAGNGTPSGCGDLAGAGAREGTLLGIPSIAVSLVGPEQGGFEEAGKVARLIAMRTLVEGLPAKTLLNVNVPGGRPKGVRFPRLR